MTLLKLPDGTETTDFAAYTRAWMELGKKVEAHGGWKLVGFNPDFQFQSPEGNGTIHLPLEFVANLVKSWEK